MIILPDLQLSSGRREVPAVERWSNVRQFDTQRDDSSV